MSDTIFAFITGLCLGAALSGFVYVHKLRNLAREYRALQIAVEQIKHDSAAKQQIGRQYEIGVDDPLDRHWLMGETLTREHDGILARCICGWTSRGHFSSMAASAAFQNHLDDMTRPTH